MKRREKALLRQYCKGKGRGFGFALLWAAVVGTALTLSGVTERQLWYPTLLGAVLLAVWLGMDFLRFARKHRALKLVRNHVAVTLDNLPEARGQIEEDYQQLLAELTARKNQQLSEGAASKAELIEYATLWTHQVKTPLTALQLLSEELEGEARGELIKRLFEIEQYSDMMLQYLRLEGDGTDFVLKAYSVKGMVNQAVRYFARMFIAKGVAVKLDIPEDAVAVTDEKWMVFVLKQLLSNALKYTREGCITISWVNGWQLVIEDTGIGIAPEDLPRIFERGYTGYNGRKDKKATGLGLFLSRRILTLLNHDISITSQVGKGTKVTLNMTKL